VREAMGLLAVVDAMSPAPVGIVALQGEW
jgi:hypothetical protein